MIPPPLTSSALTRSDAQYSIHAATSSVRGSRSLKLSCPQRRMVAYHDGAGAATGRRGGPRGGGAGGVRGGGVARRPGGRGAAPAGARGPAGGGGGGRGPPPPPPPPLP